MVKKWLYTNKKKLKNLCKALIFDENPKVLGQIFCL